MNQQQIYQFVETYLQTLDCPIIAQDQTYITAQLTVEVDKEIMNRPFYWMYVERTGGVPQPARLTFVFDEESVPEEIHGELLKFGCWRLHQIFQSAKQNGQFIRLYEEVSESTSTQGLVPWLLLNYKISFISDQKKDIYFPLGFNLVSGQVMTEFDQVLEQYQLTPKIPDYHFTLRPIYSLQSSIQEVEKHIQEYLGQHDTKWADDANQRLDGEIELIQSFFSSIPADSPKAEQIKNKYQSDQQLQKPMNNKQPSESVQNSTAGEMLQIRLAEIEQYRPRIEVTPINVGIVYLQTHPLTKIRVI